MADEFKGGDFEPIKSEDYVAPLQTAYKDINKGIDNYWSQELSNYKYAAEDAGKDMEALATMSSTIGEVLKKREDEQKKEDYAKGYMWLYENGLSAEDQENYTANEKVLEDEGAAIDNTRFDFERQGGNIWESQAFKELNKAEQHGAVVAWVESKLQQYNPATNPELKNAVSYEEYKAAESKYRLQLYKSLGDINPALVNKYLFEGQRKKEQSAYNNWYTQRESEIKKEEIRTANTSLLSCIQAGAPDVHCMDKYVNKYSGLHGGKGSARVAGLEHVKKLAENGVLLEGQTDALLDKTFTHSDGHETTYRKQFPIEAAKIEDAVDDRAANEFTRQENENKINAAKDTDALIASLDPKNITKDGYRLEAIQKIENEIQRQGLKYRGHVDPFLTKAVDSLRRDKNILKDKQLEMDIAYRDGKLNSATLKEYPIALQILPENIKKAKAGDIAIADETKFNTDIEHLVKQEAEIAPGGYDAGANQLTRHFQAKWKKRAIEIYATLSDDQKHLAGQQAYNEIKLEFETALTKENNPYQDKNGNFISPVAAYADKTISTKSIDKAISKENYYLKEMGATALDSPRLFFSEQELINMQNNSAKMGTLVIPEKAKRIAKKFDNLNAIDVINKQRVAIGMEPLTSESLELFDGLATEDKFLLNYSATSMTSARAWGGTGELRNISALRKDGELIKTISEANDIPEGHILAGTELAEELAEDNVTLDFSLPIYPQLNPEQRRAYARLRYKYGDKQALNEVIIIDNLVPEDPRPTWSSTRYRNYNEFRADVLAWKDRNFKKKNKEEIKTFQNKISHLDPKNRNVPNTDS